MAHCMLRTEFKMGEGGAVIPRNTEQSPEDSEHAREAKNDGTKGTVKVEP